MSINRDYAEFLTTFHSDKFRGLWDAQDYVLRSYTTTFSSSLDKNGTIKQEFADVAIELPTGAGKTLIALLVAEAWKQEGKKVAILSANKTLAQQMKQEADALKVSAVLMEGRSADIPAAARKAYQRAKSIAIMNYWVYFNQNPVVDPADLIIMDDAHLAELCLHSLYSVEIDKFQHKNLFEELIRELQKRFPDYNVLADALLEDTKSQSLTQLLSFIDQVEVADRFCELVNSSPCLEQDQDFAFRWLRMRRKFQEANVYISTTSIWIRPYIYPLLSNDHYKKSQQRIYFSATIDDPSDLSRRLGTNTIKKIPVPPEYVEKTSGRRLVIMDKMENEEYVRLLDTHLLRKALQIHPKSVWLCASNREAKRYQDKVSEWLREQGFSHNTWLLTPQGDEIDKFKRSPDGHLFVAGRFDGMDFNADECRIVILPNLPRAINSQESFISENLRDASFIRRRLNQRIIQALGRCNRSDNDFGVYILADPHFVNHFSTDSSLQGIPKNIIAEIDMAQELADNDEEKVVTEVVDFLRRDFSHYDLELEGCLANVPAYMPSTSEPDTSAEEILGWNALFESQNYRVAAERFKQCWDDACRTNLTEMGAFHGWHWAKALYLQSLLGEPSAREKSLRALEEAIQRGGRSAWFNRMSASLNRARQSSSAIEEIIQHDYADMVIRKFDDMLQDLNVKENKFENWCRELTKQLESNDHESYRQGLAKLGDLLGYTAMLPKYQGATDCLWRGVFGNVREIFTFEAKIEQVSSQEITSHHIGQVHNQIDRAKNEYPGYTVRGVVVTHLTSMMPDAEASAGAIKVLEKEAILDLWRRVKLTWSLYRDKWSMHDIAARKVAAQAIRTRLPKTGWLIRALDTANERFVNIERLCAEWQE
jgi:hypothetical protein